jgi:hypothetical protein
MAKVMSTFRSNWAHFCVYFIYITWLNYGRLFISCFMYILWTFFSYRDGITRDPETNNYMIILDDKCKKCHHACNAFYFQRNFCSWTSGNIDIDKFIKNTQLSAHNTMNRALEWIPYNRFDNINFIAKGGFGEVYKANWIDGRIDEWDNKNQIWKRYDKNTTVALKSLSNSKNITLEFMNEV